MRHVTRVDPKSCDTVDQSFDRSSMDGRQPCPTQPNEISDVGPDSQMTLLELFESELARKPQHPANQTEQRPLVSHSPPTASFMPSLNPPANPIALGGPTSSHLLSEPIENAIKTAVTGFELCLRGIIETMKTVQPSRSESEILADSSNVLQNLVNKDILSRKPSVKISNQSSNHTEETRIKRNAVDKDAELPQPILQANSLRKPHKIKERQGLARQEENHTLSPSMSSEEIKTQLHRKLVSSENGNLDQSIDTNGPFQYHQPGPIHLPQNDKWMQTSTQRNEIISKSTDSARNQQSLSPTIPDQNPSSVRLEQSRIAFTGDHCNRSYSPSTATARFPTIGQLEQSPFSVTTGPPLFPTLIDFTAGDGPTSSQNANLENKENVSGKAIHVSGNTLSPSTAPSITQRGLQDEREIQKDQSPSRTFRASDESLTRNTRLSHAFEISETRNTKGNSLNSDNPIRVHQLQALRRPYSDTFSKNGRHVWEPIIGPQYQRMVNGNPDAQTSSSSLPLPTPVLPTQKHLSRKLAATNSRIDGSTAGPQTRSERITGPTAHHSISNLRPQDVKIRKCVDQLIALGFDMERSRLRVYASVTDGDLDEAIDVITEDQKVHDNRRS